MTCMMESNGRCGVAPYNCGRSGAWMGMRSDGVSRGIGSWVVVKHSAPGVMLELGA